MRSTLRVAFLVWVATGVLAVTPAGASVPVPTVTGPIPISAPPGDPSRRYPFFSAADLVAAHDYVEEEFFVEGLAPEYVHDGQRTATIAPGGPHPYRTRVIVRRPRSAQRFNGTVVLEWINVVPGRPYDFETDWNVSSDHLMRRGFAHVGASVQRLGIHSPAGLKAWNPARYGALDLTAGGRFESDQLAVAIFSQVAQAIRSRSGTRLLGNLEVRTVIATGQSASAVQLTRYYNSVHPLDRVLDGFVLHGPIVGGPVRTDIQTVAWKLLAETDVLRGQAAARQPDSDYFRTWEVAGTSHLDEDSGSAHERLRARDLTVEPAPAVEPCSRPGRSRIPARLVQHAVYDWMKRWIEQKVAPPRAPGITMSSIGRMGTLTDRLSVASRDDRGNALGGIRLAQHAVPTAVNSGLNEGAAFCPVFGAHEPFHAETIARLYPSQAAYVAEVIRVTEENLKAGYITKEGADQTIEDAKQSGIGAR